MVIFTFVSKFKASCNVIHVCMPVQCSMDLTSLTLETVEIINKITPNEDELKKLDQFTKDKKNPSSLAENDRFLYDVSRALFAAKYVHVLLFA